MRLVQHPRRMRDACSRVRCRSPLRAQCGRPRLARRLVAYATAIICARAAACCVRRAAMRIRWGSLSRAWRKSAWTRFGSMARLLVFESPDAFCDQAFYGNCLRAVAKNLPQAPILSMIELVILYSADRRGPGTPALGARGASWVLFGGACGTGSQLLRKGVVCLCGNRDRYKTDVSRETSVR